MGKRRSLQFSLRTLLLLVTLSALPLAWVATHLRRCREAQHVARVLTSRGHHVIPDTRGPEWGRALLGDPAFRVVYEVELLGPDVTDEDFSALGRLRRLEFLIVGYCAIDNARLRAITSFDTLGQLYLIDCQFGDTDLRPLGELPDLEVLSLRGTDISDEDLRHLPNATIVELDQTEVSDRGLEQLSSLIGLRTLYVRDTKATDEGVAALVREVPDLEVVY